MSTKLLSLLNELFKLSHTQSLPKANQNAITIPIPSASNYMFTAPSAGYVCAYYRYVENGSQVYLGHSPTGFTSTTAMASIVTNVGSWIGAWIRVRKGDSVPMWMQVGDSAQGQIWFIPDEGS